MGLASKTQVVKFIRKGEKGDNGKNAYSPYVGANGNWYFYNDGTQQYEDSGRSATGDDGRSPYIGTNGNWYEYNAESEAYEDTGIAAKGEKGDTGATGDRGAVMRGPQLWESAEVGYSFECGAEGESWKDVVVYNDNYYYCKASHTKTETNYPGSSTGDYLWQLGDKVGLVATDLLIASDALVENLTANYITMKNSAGEVVFEAKDGDVTCKTGTFENVTVSGKVTASEGKIAGFSISGESLTNEGFNNEAAVIFRNTNTNAVAMIGGNVLPSPNDKAVARFSYGEEKDKTGTNYALLVDATGAGKNIAIYMDGGCVSGFAMNNKVIYSTQTAVTLERKDYNVICNNSSVCTITLPTMQLYDDGHVIRFKRVGNASVKIAMSYCWAYNGLTAGYSRPVIMYDRGSYITGTNTLNELDSLMDSFELVWVRDISTTLSGVTYYGAWVQYKLPRDY